MEKLKHTVFTNVSQHVDEDGDTCIQFDWDGFRLELCLSEDYSTNSLYPLYIDHVEINGEKPCPLCQEIYDHQTGNFCDTMTDDVWMNVLFHRLIQENAIRLHWLFLNYEEKETSV